MEDTISTLQRLREENEDNWKTVVKRGKREEQNEESSLVCHYFMHSSFDRERRLLDENRAKWITRRMRMITEETKERFQGKMGAEYRVDKQAVEKKPATKSPEWIERMLLLERDYMERLLASEVNEWERNSKIF